MNLDPVAIADFLQRAGIVGLLVFILVGGARRLWVWGYQLTEMTAERDHYRAIAERALGQSERTVNVADRQAELLSRKADGR